MTRLLPYWVKAWLVASAFICAIDVAFTMLRPWTTHGGCLEQVFYLWNVYADVDVRYSDPSDITTMATGRLMMAEIVLDIIALVMVSLLKAR